MPKFSSRCMVAFNNAVCLSSDFSNPIIFCLRRSGGTRRPLEFEKLAMELEGEVGRESSLFFIEEFLSSEKESAWEVSFSPRVLT